MGIAPFQKSKRLFNKMKSCVQYKTKGVCMHTYQKHNRHFLSWAMTLVLVGIMTGCLDMEDDNNSPPPEPAAFSLKASSPQDGESGSNPEQKVAMQFNNQLDVTTANNTNIKVVAPDGNPVEGSITVDQTNNIVIFTPSGTLVSNTTYHIVITTGVKSSTGVSLTNDVELNFTTGAEEESPPPTVAATTPVNGAVDIASNQKLEVHFADASIDASTVNESSLKLKKADGTPVKAKISFDQSTNVAIVTPEASLEINTEYQLEVTTDVKSLTNVSLSSSVEINFTTTAEPVATPTPTPVASPTPSPETDS